MSSFPTLHSGYLAKYPLNRVVSYNSKVIRFADDSEQRWQKLQAPLESFVLTYTDIDGLDLSNLITFFRSTKGSFTTNWNISINGVTYTNVMFDSDSLSWQEVTPNLFSLTIECKQSQQNVASYSGAAAWFPQINSSGVRVQKPYTTNLASFTTSIDMDCGQRYGWSWRNLPLSFWNLQYQTITAPDLLVLETFFDSMVGKVRTFTYLDPGGNLVTSSENFSSSWTLSSVSLGSSTSDPFNGTLATLVTGSSTNPSLWASLLPSGVPIGTVLCGSVYIRNTSGSTIWSALNFNTGPSTSNINLATSYVQLPPNVWIRAQCNYTVETNGNSHGICLQIGNDGNYQSNGWHNNTIALFGAQVTPLPNPGAYQRSPGNYAYHLNCRFDSDSLDIKSVGPGEYSTVFSVAEFGTATL